MLRWNLLKVTVKSVFEKLMLNKLKKIFITIQYYGLGFCAFRLKYAAKQKLGILQLNSPVARWDDIKLEDIVHSNDFNSNSKKILNGHRDFLFSDISTHDLEPYKQLIVEEANYILNDEFQFFFKDYHKIANDKDWLRADLNGLYWQASKHWSKTSTFDPQAGDIKFVWEPSRFAWAYTLIRAYKATGDDKYVEKFWLLLESWLRTNQPNCGPAFACGQECAIRVMAMCMAFFSFKDSDSTTEQRLLKLYKAISVHTGRIANNIDFAISTRTNHSITEAAGIYMVGLLFPEMRNSASWLENGRKILESEGLKQIYKDGSYLQHSMNYHRLMLQDYLLVFRLAEVYNDKFSDNLKNRVASAVNFLYQMQDEHSGRVPNYGANDGALIIPLNSCSYLDYRPVSQALWYLCKKEKLYKSGLWDEDMLWFFGRDSLNAKAGKGIKLSSSFDEGGYYTLRTDNSWAMIRCHNYKDRIGQIDPLHFDFWAEGKNLIKDAGSYKYYAPNESQLEEYFKSINAHNTVIVDSDSPVRKISKFTYYPKLKANKLNFDSEKLIFKGQNLAYERKPWNVTHTREVSVTGDIWNIKDNLASQGQHEATLLWHICNDAELIEKSDSKVILSLDAQWQMIITGENLSVDILDCFESLYYGNKNSSKTLVAKSVFDKNKTFNTIIKKG